MSFEILHTESRWLVSGEVRIGKTVVSVGNVGKAQAHSNAYLILQCEQTAEALRTMCVWMQEKLNFCPAVLSCIRYGSPHNGGSEDP